MSVNERKLYLIPSTLGNSGINRVIPSYNLDVIGGLRHFVVEEERTARRFLIQCGLKDEISRIQFYLLNEHTPETEILPMFLNSGEADLGLLSEAGLPAVADPGAKLVREAYKQGIKVIPLVGPSSLMLALMASGLNGQQFAFNGYLPVKPTERNIKIRFLEKRSETDYQSQLLIEAPYRNKPLFDALLLTLKPSTRLCVAINLTLPEEWIVTKSVGEWKKSSPPEWKKQPAVFIFQA
jgi:16S rRNA (cytidine1402-2'-O)-methyltransferase